MVTKSRSPLNAASRLKHRLPTQITFSAVPPPAESLSSDGDNVDDGDDIGDDDDGDDRDDATSAGFSLCTSLRVFHVPFGGHIVTIPCRGTINRGQHADRVA